MVTLFRLIIRSILFSIAWAFIWLAYFLTADRWMQELDDFYKERFWKYK